MKSAAAIVLAAGASTRLGRPKQLVKIGEENLLERVIHAARDAGCSPIVVVLGASADSVRSGSNLKGTEVVINQEWQDGMSSSIRVGVREVGDVEGVVVTVCDMPAVTSSHIRTLAESDEVTASSYAGKRGVPAYFPRSIFPVLTKLQGEFGARDILRHARSVELPGGALDVDTEDDLEMARHLFGSSAEDTATAQAR